MGRFASCALTLFLTFPGWSQSESMRFIRPDASVVAGMQWKRLISSEAGGTLRRELKKSVPTMPGIEAIEKLLFEDIDSLVLAATLKEPGKAGPEAPFLVVVKGRFTSGLQAFLSGKSAPEVYRGVQVMTPANMKPPTTRFALLDENTLLAGDRREVLAAIDRRARPAIPALSKRAAALASRYDMWVVADAPPMTATPTGGKMTGFEAFADQVKSFEAGTFFADGLGLDINVLTKSEDAASKMAQSLQGLLGVAGMTKEGAEMADFIQKVKVASEASKVTMSLVLDKTDLEKLMQKAQARATMASASTRNQPPSPARGTIRIEGLDSGPLEIQASQRK